MFCHIEIDWSKSSRWCVALLSWHQPDNCQLIRQRWSHPSRRVLLLHSSPPPSLSHKPVTPLRQRTGVTFSSCAVLCFLPSLHTFLLFESSWTNMQPADEAGQETSAFIHSFLSLPPPASSVSRLAHLLLPHSKKVKQTPCFEPVWPSVRGLRPSLTHTANSLNEVIIDWCVVVVGAGVV